jgi:hypothetical protein
MSRKYKFSNGGKSAPTGAGSFKFTLAKINFVFLYILGIIS